MQHQILVFLLWRQCEWKKSTKCSFSLMVLKIHINSSTSKHSEWFTCYKLPVKNNFVNFPSSVHFFFLCWAFVFRSVPLFVSVFLKASMLSISLVLGCLVLRWPSAFLTRIFSLFLLFSVHFSKHFLWVLMMISCGCDKKMSFLTK